MPEAFPLNRCNIDNPFTHRHIKSMPRLRRTKQQIAIEEVFKCHTRPLSPHEVLELAKQDVPNLGMATVYRTLNQMVEDGSLHVVELPGQSSRYEPSDKHHHHHFHCTSCNKVIDLDGCLLKEDLNLPEGFVVKNHSITLSGRCPDCGE